MPIFSLVNLLFFAGVPTISPSFAVAGAWAFVDLVVELSDFGAVWQPNSKQTEPTAIASSGSFK